MQAGFQVVSTQWGFSWHPEWRSFREAEPPGRLAVALTDGSTWYHGRAYPRGSAGISLAVNSPENTDYPGLTDSLMSAFYHELFHNLQRSLNMHRGGDGDVDGLDDAWQFFSEGSAVLATSIAQPRLQFSKSPGAADYFRQANGFLAGGGGRERDLKRSYQEIEPYHAVLYWRYLYEQCGGLSREGENPQRGWQVILNALTALYSCEIVDLRASADLVKYLPGIMDAAIQQARSCPFEDYQESLLGFTRVIYQLNLQDGRCEQPGFPDGCGLYDPGEKYLYLPIHDIAYSGPELTLDSSQSSFTPGIRSSIGMQFLEINLAHETLQLPLTIELLTPGSRQAEFALQVAVLNKRRSTAISFIEAPQIPGNREDFPGSQHVPLKITLYSDQPGVFNQLGLLVTRIDHQEDEDPAGEYTLLVYQEK
jgi:hypothetical protein